MTQAAGFESRALFPLVALVALPDGHRLCRRRQVEVADLVEEQMLLLRPDFMTRQLYDGACKMLGVENDLEKEDVAVE
jgi:DNA-binding transcriptional LysR family regulator